MKTSANKYNNRGPRLISSPNVVKTVSQGYTGKVKTKSAVMIGAARKMALKRLFGRG